MSKLIVEMGMPICCADCPCCICLNGMKPAYCKAVMVDDDNIVDGLMWRETDPNNRPSWCPIKGVLPDEHGDLVDRDEVKQKMIHYGFSAIDMTATEFCEDELQTVIAAERSET